MATCASPVDVGEHGTYAVHRDPGDTRPVYRFTDRITADGASGYPAVGGRYHVYAGWFCPWSQRVTLELALNGLAEVVSVSFVDDERDGRGWAFRETHGPDPVNGFALLREAYDRTEPGFDGLVSVPTLWDRVTGRVVSNDFRLLGIDLATQFGATAGTYPEHLRDEIEALDAQLGPDVNQGISVAGGDGPGAPQARERLLARFAELEERLSGSRFLLGDQLTEADVRLWVSVVRYDAEHNVGGRIGPALPHWPALWRWGRELYALPAFRSTTRFASFTGPGAVQLEWEGER